MNLYFATSNTHKLVEVGAILASAGLPLNVLPACAVGGMPVVVEDGDTFQANATKKALALRRQVLTLDSNVKSQDLTSFLTAADDSGLCVDALGGAPGVRSARYAGENATDEDNNAKLLEALGTMPDMNRTAAFHCVIAVTDHGGAVRTFAGRCPGHILTRRRGAGGFGYDPLFVPEGYEQTYAELGDEEKNRISHRARALAAFADWYRASR